MYISYHQGRLFKRKWSWEIESRSRECVMKVPLCKWWLFTIGLFRECCSTIYRLFFVGLTTKNHYNLDLAQRLLCSSYRISVLVKITIPLSIHILCSVTLENTKRIHLQSPDGWPSTSRRERRIVSLQDTCWLVRRNNAWINECHFYHLSPSPPLMLFFICLIFYKINKIGTRNQHLDIINFILTYFIPTKNRRSSTIQHV